MNLILLGAPGAGKGTQAEILRKELNIPTISTGNIIRESMHNGTEMGLKAKAFVDAGKLVPDEVVIGIIRERLAEKDCENGFILDGFPRTIPQAHALEDMGVKIDYAIEIGVSEERILSRMTGRRVCPKCGATYHLVNMKPKKDGVCDNCTTELIQRKDDNPETVLDRIRVYHEQTEPLKEFYAERGILYTVNGETDDATTTTKEILELLGEKQ